VTARVFRIRGMDCAEEVAVLKDVVGPLVGGPERLSFDILNGKMTVGPEASPVADQVIARAIARTGMQATRWSAAVESVGRDSGRRIRAILTIASAVLTLSGFATHVALTGD
jgi:Cd2+/Zn2+-exporting ATPase